MIAGKICGGITKPVTLLNYRVQPDTAYTAPVSGPDRHRPLFKLRRSKHGVSFQLQPLSSPPPSDCCGEVFFREYHPHLCEHHCTNTYIHYPACKQAPTQIRAQDTSAETPDEPRGTKLLRRVCSVKLDLFPLNSATVSMLPLSQEKKTEMSSPC